MALAKATLTNTQTGEQFAVMFNPAEYTLDLGNTFAEIGIPGLAVPPIQYVRGNSRSLKLELFFDTYEEHREGSRVLNRAGDDVRMLTGQITKLLEHEPTLKAPPILLFSWGGLNFQCVLESVGQRFTMFLGNGTPVRATLTVNFKEYQRVEVDVRSGLFVVPPTVHNVVAGNNLSKIAGEILGDPEAWREIADYNNIDDPRRIEPGRQLVIPPRQGRARSRGEGR